MYVYVYISVCVYVYIYKCVYVHLDMHIYTSMCIQKYIFPRCAHWEWKQTPVTKSTSNAQTSISNTISH